jgi:hypothetical protein
MIKIHIALVSTTCALVASTTLAFAQRPQDVQCKPTETQAECHKRLKCKPGEELEDCQKRLLKCNAGELLEECERRVAQGGGGQQGNAGQQQGNGGQQQQQQQGQRDQGQRDQGQRDQGQRDNGDQRRGDRDSDRGNRDRDADRRDRDRSGGEVRDRDEGSRGRRSRQGGDSGNGFEANKTFGLGLELGEPDGLNGKVFISKNGAIDFGLGAMYHDYYYGDGFHIYADYLWHPVTITKAEAFELPFYIGGGLRYWDFNYCYLNMCTYGGNAIGIRVPFGIAFDFNNVPLDIFLQLVPVVDFLGGDYYTRYGDRTHFGFDFSAGIRFWFK